jgi:hypothetical protein
LGGSAVFVNEAPGNPVAADFHLTALGGATFQGGTTLAAPYNVDPDGQPRGAGGHWSIGAYQFGTCDGGCGSSADGGSSDGGLTSDAGLIADAGTPPDSGATSFDSGRSDAGAGSTSGSCACSGAAPSAGMVWIGLAVLAVRGRRNRRVPCFHGYSRRIGVGERVTVPPSTKTVPPSS